MKHTAANTPGLAWKQIDADHLIYGTPRTAKCPHCNQLLDAFGVCPDVPPEEAAIGIKYCMEGL